MSTDTPDGSSTDTENDPWEPAVLRDLVPDSLGSEGTSAVVCAIRNPDANAAQIARKCDLASSYTVGNALRSLLVGTAGEHEASGAEMIALRGSSRDAETYAELTEKQQAIIDFAAEHPQFVADHTYGDISQAIHEKEGVAVAETYLGRILEKYAEILHRRRAHAAAEGEGEAGDSLEDVATDLTVRETLAAAGFDLPDENLDTMPDAGVEIEAEDRQATLGEAQQAEAEFQQASEVAQEQAEDEAEAEAEAEQDGGQERPSSGATWLSDEWVAQQDVPGSEQAQRLPDEASDEDVEPDTPYWAYVNGTPEYGVFVSLTNPVPVMPKDDVSGLIYEMRLEGSADEYERGDPLVVELQSRNLKGLEFVDWRVRHGNEQQEQDSQEQPDSGAEQDEAQAAEAEDEQQEQPDSADEQPASLAERVEGLEQSVDALREDAALRSEVGEFAGEVEDRLDDLRDALDRVEAAQGGTVEAALGMAEQEGEAHERLEQRVDSLQEMVNGLGEQVQHATDASGGLGRAQRALQRLEASGAEVQAYRYEHQHGTVTLHLEATLDEGDSEDTDR